MRSGSSALLSSPPLCFLAARTGLVDVAVDYLMIRKDFQAAFDACEKGLESLANSDEQEETSSRHGEWKVALCIVGIQALAELNKWRGVLTWVLQNYSEVEKIPAKIMQMCILLYTKVAEQAEVQAMVRTWLHCSSNMSQPGYSSVTELYILHVLLPLGHTTEAAELLEDKVGRVAFTEDQRQTAFMMMENCDAKKERLLYPFSESASTETDTRGRVITPQGSLVRRLHSVVRLLYRGLATVSTNIRSCSLHKALLLLLLLYLLLIRMDPALPSAFPWIFRLYGLFQQMWNAMFGPYYNAFS